MKRILQACLFVILVAFSISLPAAMKRLTHSFHVSRFSLDFSKDLSNESSRISMPEVRQILSQDYNYLGRGSQAFVFASKDGFYVLKLFIFDFADSFAHRFFYSLPGVSSSDSYSKQVKKRALQTLEACRLAERFLPEDTAIVYTHLNPGSEYLPTVRLRGPAWKIVNIHPDSFRFVLQKRAKLLNESLMQAYLLDDRQRFFCIIDQLNALLNRRTACCIVNTDPTLFENFGVIGERPVEIDFGNFIYCPEMIAQKRFQMEKTRYTDQLLIWVERYIPQWKDDVAMRIKENK